MQLAFGLDRPKGDFRDSRSPQGIAVRRDAGSRHPRDRRATPHPRIRGRRRAGCRDRLELHRRGVRRRPAPRIGDAWAADIVFRVNPPTTERDRTAARGATLVSLLSPALEPGAGGCAGGPPDHGAGDGRGAAHLPGPVAGRASSMANIAGYRAVIEAAHVFGRFFTGQVTAAARCRRPRCWSPAPGWPGWPRSARPAAWARSCGRPTRGPRWPTRCARSAGSTSGRVGRRSAPTGTPRRRPRTTTRARPRDLRRAGRRRRHHHHHRADPGPAGAAADHRRAWSRMRPGSVIVDMAAAQGGNVDGPVAGEVVVTANGVTIIGYTDLPGRLPAQASQLYGTNLVNLMKLLTPAKDGAAGARLRRRGAALDHGRPRRREDLAAAAGAGVGRTRAAPPTPRGRRRRSKAPRAPRRPDVHAGRARRRRAVPAHRVLAQPADGHFSVFVLAVVIGYYVIGKVHHALHTPLMSVTNAISGIIVVGALLQIGQDDTGSSRCSRSSRSCWRPSTSSVASP